MIVREGKVVVGIEPAVVRVAEAFEFADVDHEIEVAPGQPPSSVTPVTAISFDKYSAIRIENKGE
jgi:hypothetical protein